MSVEDFEDTKEFYDDQVDLITRHQIEDYPDDAADENSKLQFTSANSSSTDVAELRERDERDQRFNALLMALIQSKRD